MNYQHRICNLQSGIRRANKRAKELLAEVSLFSRIKEDEHTLKHKQSLQSLADHYIAVAHGRQLRLDALIGT